MTEVQRPLVVWLYCAAIVAWAIWLLVTASIPAAQRGIVSPFAILVGYGSSLLGLLGFWMMRWWGVILFAAASILPILFAPLTFMTTMAALSALIVGPMFAIAYFYRVRFRL